MRNLSCHRLEMDEIWGYAGKEEKHLREGDDPTLGNVWTYCAIDADTKLVPTRAAIIQEFRSNVTAEA